MIEFKIQKRKPEIQNRKPGIQNPEYLLEI